MVTLESRINVAVRLLIFELLFQGLRSYEKGLRLLIFRFSCTTTLFFFIIELRLLFLSNVPEATFIDIPLPSTFIPDS